MPGILLRRLPVWPYFELSPGACLSDGEAVDLHWLAQAGLGLQLHLVTDNGAGVRFISARRTCRDVRLWIS